jgi:hypothetical protein
MKTTSIPLLGFALGLALLVAPATTIQADTNTVTTAATTTCPTGKKAGHKKAGHKAKGHRGGGVLTADEKSKMKSVREQVVAADPSIKAEHDAIRDLRKDKGATADREAVRERAKALHAKVNAAMVAADPTVKPILDKLAAARPHGKKAKA